MAGQTRHSRPPCSGSTSPARHSDRTAGKAGKQGTVKKLRGRWRGDAITRHGLSRSPKSSKTLPRLGKFRSEEPKQGMGFDLERNKGNQKNETRLAPLLPCLTVSYPQPRV